jgi:glutamate carboxypeptidase
LAVELHKSGQISMKKQQEIQDYLEDKLPSYLEMLRQMVEINSFTENPAGVNELGHMTAAVFAGLGFSSETVQATNPKFGRHLVMTRNGTGNHTVGLVTHLDTVFPAAEEIANNFHWRVAGDRIYGPGTVDIKGGTVLIYMLLDALHKFAPKQFEATNWVILADACEEQDGEDFGALCRAWLNGALACLVFEGGLVEDNRFHILVKRKGMSTYRVRVTGKASHAGTAHAAGANAIVQMGEVIQKIAALTDYSRELTFNVGTVHGGTVTNRVPHECEALVEMRCYDKTTYDAGVAGILALNGYSTVQSKTDGYPCQTTVEVLRQTPPWPENAGSEKTFEFWRAAAEELGYEAIRSWRGGLSDGNFTWAAIPTLDALGPNGAYAHCSERAEDGSKDQEYCLPDSFVPKTLLNVAAVLKMIEA